MFLYVVEEFISDSINQDTVSNHLQGTAINSKEFPTKNKEKQSKKQKGKLIKTIKRIERGGQKG